MSFIMINSQTVTINGICYNDATNCGGIIILTFSDIQAIVPSYTCVAYRNTGTCTYTLVEYNQATITGILSFIIIY